VSKDKPRNVAASVRHRLLEIARKQGEDFQLVLTRYVIERLLYRLSRDLSLRCVTQSLWLPFAAKLSESHSTRALDNFRIGAMCQTVL
jgi:hypothetical protein